MFAILCITISLLTFIGCNRISYDAYEELVGNLENMGYTIEVKDIEENEILVGKQKRLTLNKNERISVYLYNNSDSMEKDASYISSDGFSYNHPQNTVLVEWAAPPHFFNSENMIILYVGENSEIIHALEELVGPQFAGFRYFNKQPNLVVHDTLFQDYIVLIELYETRIIFYNQMHMYPNKPERELSDEK